MNSIKYVKFSDINPKNFISVLNQERVREHLVSHNFFDTDNIKEWVKLKIECDSMSGCRIRAVFIDNILAGWCGIQKDNEHYEIAIVISKSFWGFGILIFKNLMSWAKELGHQEIVIHLLETRPEYRFLKRVSTKTHETKMLGRNFITYHIAV